MEVLSHPIDSQMGRWEPREGKGFATGHTARLSEAGYPVQGFLWDQSLSLLGRSFLRGRTEGCPVWPQQTSQPSRFLLCSSVAMRSQGQDESPWGTLRGSSSPCSEQRPAPGCSHVHSSTAAHCGQCRAQSRPCSALLAAWGRACVLQEGRSRDGVDDDDHRHNNDSSSNDNLAVSIHSGPDTVITSRRVLSHFTVKQFPEEGPIVPILTTGIAGSEWLINSPRVTQQAGGGVRT